MRVTRTQLRRLIENMMREDVILDDEGKPVKYKMKKQKKLGKTDDMSKDYSTLKNDMAQEIAEKLRAEIADSIPFSYWKGSKLQKGKSFSLSGSQKNKNKIFQKEIEGYLSGHGFKSEDDIITISIKKLKDYFRYIKNSNYNLFNKNYTVTRIGKVGVLKDREIILVFGKSQKGPAGKGMSHAAEAARLDAMEKIDAKFGGPFHGRASVSLEKDHLDSLGIAAPINFIYGHDKKLGYMFAGVYAIPTAYIHMQLFEKARPDLVNPDDTEPDVQKYDPKDIV